MNSTLLAHAMHVYNISVIISWNHLRHVTPVFFYLMLMHFLGPRLSEQMGFAQNVTFEYKKLVLLLVVISFTITFGALHHAAFDDDVLYMYKGGHVDVRGQELCYDLRQ